MALALLLACLQLANAVRWGYWISNRAGGPMCRGGICVELKLQEPIRAGEPVAVTITVRTQRDIPGLEVILDTQDSAVQTVGSKKWTLDTKADQSIQVFGAIRFPRKVVSQS